MLAQWVMFLMKLGLLGIFIGVDERLGMGIKISQTFLEVFNEHTSNTLYIFCDGMDCQICPAYRKSYRHVWESNVYTGR